MSVALERGPSLLSAIRRQLVLCRNTLSCQRDEWDMYGSKIKSYEEEFRSVLDGTSIINFVKSRKNPVILDIMAPSDTLADLFSRVPSDPLRFGLAVSLKDRRDEKERERDTRLGIEQIAGDIMTSSTWRKISKALSGRKADLIMERAEAGLYFMPCDRRLYAILISKSWRILSKNNGLLLIQTPNPWKLIGDDIPIRQWVDLLNKNGIDAWYGSPSGDLESGALKIVKGPNAPEDLPLLP